jgi:hypothetical protein
MQFKHMSQVKVVKITNGVLVFLVAVVAILAVRGGWVYSKQLEVLPASHEITAVELSGFESSASGGDNIAVIGRRQLFRKAPRAATRATGPTPALRTIRDLAAPLRLVGVVMGSPPYAIVENRTSGGSYDVRVGDVVNELVVDNIFEKYIVLRRDDETLELSL